MSRRYRRSISISCRAAGAGGRLRRSNAVRIIMTAIGGLSRASLSLSPSHAVTCPMSAKAGNGGGDAGGLQDSVASGRGRSAQRRSHGLSVGSSRGGAHAGLISTTNRTLRVGRSLDATVACSVHPFLPEVDFVTRDLAVRRSSRTFAPSRLAPRGLARPPSSPTDATHFNRTQRRNSIKQHLFGDR